MMQAYHCEVIVVKSFSVLTRGRQHTRDNKEMIDRGMQGPWSVSLCEYTTCFFEQRGRVNMQEGNHNTFIAPRSPQTLTSSSSTVVN